MEFQLDDYNDRLTEAGFKFDGHVTNGSLEETKKVIQNIISAALAADSEAYFASLPEVDLSTPPTPERLLWLQECAEASKAAEERGKSK